MTDELLDVTLETLRENPPETIIMEDKYENYYRPSAAPPLRDDEGNLTVKPYLTDFMARGRPFIFHTVDGNGNEKQWIWDGAEEDPYELDGWVDPDQGVQPMGPYVTCKYFVPSQVALEEDECAALPKDYEFNRSSASYHGCNNPELGPACGYMDNQPMCDFYEAEVVSIPVHYRTIQSDGTVKELMVQSVRLNRGIRTMQGVKLSPDQTTPNLHTRTGSLADLQSMIQETTEAAKQSGEAADITLEEVNHQPPRNSFLKGLLPK